MAQDRGKSRHSGALPAPAVASGNPFEDIPITSPEAPERLAAALAERYRIERELGQGGMATVYLAADLRHDRRVAIKVLKPELAAVIGAERFLAEIRTTANLQHPNILPLFDSGRTGGPAGAPGEDFLFYVMPYVEGESLRERLRREKQLPIDDAVAIATEVAAALDYAHRRGIVHRDVKPENILLHEGRALVADFGIALAASRAAGARMTETGMSLGTPQYMSPEQAMGERDITARSDIYALGCVTYEMLAGEPPYTGPTAQAIVARVLTTDVPALRPQRATVSAALEAAILRALEKVPADRWKSAAAFAEALGQRTAPVSEVPLVPAGRATPSPRPSPRALAWAALALLAAIGVWGWRRRDPARVPPAVTARAVIPIAPERLSERDDLPFAISAEGTALVYVGELDGAARLFLRPMGEFAARPIPGTEGARQPFFSPDGRWIGFVADGKLQKVPREGGAPIVLARLPAAWGGADWREGTILYAAGGDSLFRLSDQGGTPTPVPLAIASDNGSGSRAIERVRWPRFLPDGRHALLTVDTMVALADLSSGTTRLLQPGSQARYLPTGHLLYQETEGRMRLVRFDPRRGERRGSPLPVFEAFRSPGGGATQFAVSDGGTLVYVAGGFERSLVLVDRNGRETSLGLDPRGYRFPRFSPDGQRVSVTVDPRPSQIWVVDLRRSSAVPLTSEGHNITSVWSPDGRRIAYSGAELRWIPFPAGDPQPVLTAEARRLYPVQWSTRYGIIAQAVDSARSSLVRLDIGDSVPARLTSGAGEEWQGQLSPDESWFAYASNVSGTSEIYVRPAAGGEAILVSPDGGADPRWSPGGGELYYRRGGQIMVAEVRLRPTFEVLGAPRVLFSGPYDFSQGGNWDVGRDGRFVMVRGDPAANGRLLVVLNWFEEIRRMEGR